MSSASLEMSEILENNPLGSFQKMVMLFCALVIVFDGFDVLAIAFAAPALSAALDIPREELAYVFSAGLVGMMIGALVMGPVGDKYGRRSAVIFSVIVFAVFTLLTGFVNSYDELLLLRFLTGLGLGGAMPNATALITEYVSSRQRNVAVAVIFLGMPIGGITGGLLASELIPVFGWPSLFFVGGIAPLLLVPILLLWLPESPRFLLEHEKDNDELMRVIARRIELRNAITDNALFVQHTEDKKHFPVKALFLEGRARDTVLIWLMFFFNLMVVYFLYSWIPTLLMQAGYQLAEASRTVVVLNIGGALSPFVFSRLIRNFGSKVVLTSCFVLGSISMIAVGQLGSSLNLVMALSFFSGFFIVGGQISMNALSSYLYPTHIRSTGVGWANGIGRSGSIIGPLLAGALVTASFGLNMNFIVFGGLCLVTATASFFIRNHENRARV
ncbi:MFS transporter [Halieaceae bacterium IMCC8485]|uniref:MFS transporter n=1 Tax=Candidatus Seongchinamella marina TaxID=2518990 RepID=A0ABT3SZK9_9GAMM|nr:MFS transporter [Candidatus Seongchinamella marina]MCX2975446.1 MFS transporter [Candidatus Seongchinamella marina]